MAWWDAAGYYKRITIFATMITAVIAAVIAMANAMNAQEPYWIATHGFTRTLVQNAVQQIDKTQQQLKTRQVQTEIQIVKGRTEAIRSKISDRKLLLQQPDGPANYKNLIAQQVEEFNDQLKGLERQLDELRGEMAGR